MAQTILGAMTVISDVIFLIRAQIGEGLLPAFKELQQRFVSFITQSKQAIVFQGRQFFQPFIEMLEKAGDVLPFMLRDIGSLVEVMGGLRVVMKGLLALFSIFTGFKLLAGIGNVAMATRSLTKALTLGTAGLLSVPVVAGAAFLFLAGVLSDIAGFFRGFDSVTGRLIERFDKDFPGTMKKLRKTLLTFGKEVLEPLGALFKGIFHLDIDEIGAAVKELFQNLKKIFKEAGEELRATFTQALSGGDETQGFAAKGKKSGVSDIDVLKQFGLGTLTDLTNMARRLVGEKPIGPIGGGRVSNTTNNSAREVTFNVQMPPGTTLQQASTLVNEAKRLIDKDRLDLFNDSRVGEAR